MSLISASLFRRREAEEKGLRIRAVWVGCDRGLLGDRITKYWVMDAFQLQETRPLWPGVFHFTYVENPGAAFSLFSGQGDWLRWLSLAVSLALAVWVWLSPRLNRWEQWGYGFIFSGAFGNGIDRFATGRVVDFLDFRLIHFPVFNVADVMINVGIVCLLLGAWFVPHPKRR
ncbi:MAG: lipoprotein signal peptidase [Synechococcales cyanobacterium RU_4_20]|nr:lipoprotein signal peptidase [Synechococcales cyanobacterium RU_4_20]